MTELLFYKTNEAAYIPKLATSEAACFDLHASLIPSELLKCYEYGNSAPSSMLVNALSHITVAPNMRVLVPVNLIFDIPLGYSVRIHPRSGMTLKQGLTLFNCEGVIDSDYVDPVFITIYNISGVDQVITDGDRIAQAELVKLVDYQLAETTNKPVQKGNRSGGFGSTGV
jgi:dUTP pyrophosphatase